MKKPRINQRRYSEVIRLLKRVVNDEKQPIERRMRAADKLVDLYDRHDRLNERRAREAARAEVPEPTVTPETQPDTPEPELTAAQQAERFLETMRSKGYGEPNRA